MIMVNMVFSVNILEIVVHIQCRSSYLHFMMQNRLNEINAGDDNKVSGECSGAINS